MFINNKSELDTWTHNHKVIQGHDVIEIKSTLNGKSVVIAYEDTTTNERFEVCYTWNLVDEDGENLAVRAFLMLYGSSTGITIAQMREHLTLMRYPFWPEHIGKVDSNAYLTKFDAQEWLRYLFNLEKEIKTDGRNTEK